MAKKPKRLRRLHLLEDLEFKLMEWAQLWISEDVYRNLQGHPHMDEDFTFNICTLTYEHLSFLDHA